MTFGDAVNLVKRDKIVSRTSWDNKWIKLFYMSYKDKTFVFIGDNDGLSWLPTHKDMLAEDWIQILEAI